MNSCDPAANLGFKSGNVLQGLVANPIPCSPEETSWPGRLLPWCSTLCIVLLASYTVIWEFFSFHVSRALSSKIIAALNSCGVSCRKELLGIGV